MSLPLILFFTSLLGMAAMIGRKFLLIEEIREKHTEGLLINVPDLEEIKDLASEKIKKHGYNALVATLRFSMKSSHYIKTASRGAYVKAKDKLNRLSKKEGEQGEPKEVSKFLKMISEYKHKIRKIKHKIKEEENIN